MHRGGPELTVLVEIGSIRERVFRQAVFGEFFRLRVEQRDLAGPIFGHQDAILVIDLHAPSTRMRGRYGVPRHLRRLGIDLAEMAFGEFGHPKVVLGVRHHLINAGILDGRQLVGRMEPLPCIGRQIEPEDVLRADALRPDLAVDIVAQSCEIQLHAVIVIFRRQRIIGNLAGLRVQAAERALVHRVEPDLAGMVELDAEESGGRLVLELLDRIFGELERLRIELADEHLAEVRIPDMAFLIDQDVMRFGRRPHHVVLSDDGACVLALRARQRLQFVLPMVDRAQIDGREIVGDLAVLLRRARAGPIQHGLRLDGLAHRAIAHHPADDPCPLVGIVRRAHDSFQRVTAGAIEQRRLLLFRAGDAHHPLGVGELAGEIFGLLELDGGRGGLLRLHGRLDRRVDVVADRADADRVFARLQSVFGEGVAALRVGGHADLHGRAGLLGGDDDTFHVAFGVGAYGAGQCRLALRPNRLSCWMEEHHRCTGGEAQHQFASHRVLPNENLSSP